jgi:hypothetical protein
MLETLAPSGGNECSIRRCNSASIRHLPEALITQLMVGGILVILVGEAIWQVHKTPATQHNINKHPNFVFALLQRQTRPCKATFIQHEVTSWPPSGNASALWLIIEQSVYLGW